MADNTPKFKPFKFCSKRYGYVLLAAGLLTFQDFTFAYGGMGIRGTAFNDDFMKKNFEQLHQLMVSRDAPCPKMGYPDQGAGFFARQLPYEQWYRFNIHQRIHNNSLEHLSWLMPLLLVQGAFMPRFAASMAGVILTGRELYRFGYLSKDGPSSRIREAGAVPLNAAAFFLINSLAFFVMKRRTGDFFSRRKFVRRFTHSHYDIRMEKVKKDADLASKGIVIGGKKPTYLPQHPKIIEQMQEKRAKEAAAKKTPLQIKKEAARAQLPDIASHM